MRYDLSRFKSGTDHIDRTFQPGEFQVDAEDFRIASPVHLTADLTKNGAKFHLRGRLTATLELACSRCLEMFDVPVDAALDLTFVPAVEPAKPAAESAPARQKRSRAGHTETEDVELDGSEIAEDEVGLSEYSGDEIDLGQMMREQFYLALPMKPLCTPDCKGLCPVCGKNRNRETCSCESTWVDPRFEALRKFRKDETH